MVTTAATFAFFPVAYMSPNSSWKTSGMSGDLPANLDIAQGIMLKPASCGSLLVKANAQARPQIKDAMLHPFGLGRVVEDGQVFRQNFSIRSYEVGADRMAPIETLMNHLQETALNHVENLELMGDGFASTPKMHKYNLIWVFTKMQILVDRYPMWGDVVQVETWSAASGKNGLRRDWLIYDHKAGDILMRASGVLVMMNKETRRLSRMPEDVRGEILPCLVDSHPVVEEDCRKLPKLDDSTADYIRNGLAPRWNDLDINQHVNNVTYISWILESIPSSVMEGYELGALTLEYRKECKRDCVLLSLTTVPGTGIDNLLNSGCIEYVHSLQLEGGGEIVRARTKWRPKYASS